MSDFVVTYGKKAQGRQIEQAKAWATELGVPYVPRYEKGVLDDMLQQEQAASLLIATEQGPQVYSAGGTFAYHPGMATLRYQNLLKGQKDNFLEATGLQPGMRFLDGTLGLASDALIASWAVGTTGQVVGVEASALLHFVVQRGLQAYEAKFPELTAAMRRIKTVQQETGSYLRSLPADSFEVIYFDPMFRFPVEASSSMEPLRPLAYEHPLQPELLQEALRVAPKVVIKERWERILRDLGCRKIMGGKYSTVRYGLLES